MTWERMLPGWLATGLVLGVVDYFWLAKPDNV
jgi:hypothetical protein